MKVLALLTVLFASQVDAVKLDNLNLSQKMNQRFLDNFAKRNGGLDYCSDENWSHGGVAYNTFSQNFWRYDN